MLNNLDKIRKLLSFTDENDFYFVQVLKRRKDNPEMKSSRMSLGSYYIESLEHFDNVMPHIIRICDSENGRAYIHLNRRNYEHLSYHLLKQMVVLISSKTYKPLKNVFDSVVGKHHNDKNKTWVVDIDWVDMVTPDNVEGKYRLAHVKYDVTKLQEETKNEPRMDILPTKNGVHLITRPFNLKKFKDKYPEIDVHKSSPTLLYIS